MFYISFDFFHISWSKVIADKQLHASFSVTNILDLYIKQAQTSLGNRNSPQLA